MDRLSEILAEILDVLSLIWFYITEGITAFMQWIGGIFQSISLSDFAIELPASAPTMTRIFNNTAFCTAVLLIIFIYIIAINIAAFAAFGEDKEHATRREERISEKSLMRLCLLGGSFGGFIGMKVFHHKTLKKKFSIGIPILLLIQLVLFSFIMGFFGFWIYIR